MNAKELSKLAHAAVRGACKENNVSPEDRWDIAQDLVVEILTHEPPIEDVKGWLYVVVFKRVWTFLEKEKQHRELIEYMHVAGSRPYRGKIAPELGVEYMAVKPSKRTSGKNDVEDALIAAIDARARSGQGPKRKTISPQEQVWLEILQIQRKHQKSLV